MDVKTYDLKCASISLEKFSKSKYDTDGAVVVTVWPDHEGWDIETKDHWFSLTIAELKAINYLTSHLELL